MRKALLFFSLITFLFTSGILGQDKQSFNPKTAHYLWPTEASPYLSSTFGETRSSHFHAALDIKTWGQRGYEVYATRDGIIDRIAIGPRGYGKVVYLKHSDGSYSVYAHLLSFNSQLQQLADSIRFAEDYKFEIERFLGWRNMKIKQGNVIGYSGASGIGPPHLHFELRTPSHRPFNPLLTNLTVDDNIAPQILGISVEPLSPESSIEGENKVYTKRAWGKKGRYELGTINITGPVGLGINVFDQSNHVNNSYAVYEISMSIDGQELFRSRADSFSYSETDQMFIDRVYPILKKADKGYQRLYVADGNTLPFYETSSTNGILDLEPGSHTVTIRTADYYGNSSTATMRLFVREKEAARTEILRKNPTPKQIAPPHKWNWFDNWVTLSKNQFSQVNIGADSGNFIQHENGITVPLKELDNLFMNIPGIGPVSLHRINPNSVNIISSDDQKSFAVFPEKTVYDTVSAGMAVQKKSDNSTTVNMLPEAYPLRNSYKFYIQRNSGVTDTTKWSFYKLDREDHEWDIIPTAFSDTHVIGEAESLGMFTMQKDTTAPKLDNPRLIQRVDEQWVIMIDAKDNLSEIDYKRTKISVNGVQGIAEFEPEDDRLVYYHPNFVPSSFMKIEVIVFDKMGNKRFLTFALENDIEHTKHK
jgi:hypothetical protein